MKLSNNYFESSDRKILCFVKADTIFAVTTKFHFVIAPFSIYDTTIPSELTYL